MSTDGIPWQPGVWRRIPWRTVGALTGFSVTCGMMALVLVLSEDKETNSWPTHNKYVTVPVLLSLMGAIAVVFLSVANAEGFAISWWLKALKGTKVKELQYDLEVTGNMLVGVFRPTLFNTITLSSLISIIVSIAVGAILQKSSTTISKTIGPYAANVDAPILNTTLPSTFSGWSGGGTETSLLMPTFANVYRQFSNRSDIVIPSGCVNSTCQLHIPGPGFDVDCADSSIEYNFGNLAAAKRDASPFVTRNAVTAFSTSIDWDPQDQEASTLNHLNISVVYKSTPDISGKLTQHHCVLRAAAVDYTVTITNGTAALAPWQLSHNITISMTNYTDWMKLSWGSVGAGGWLTMLGGIASVLQAQYNSNTTLRIAVMTAIPFLVTANGQAASTFLTSEVEDYGNWTMTWSDPREDIINNIQELMFRSALAVANTTGEPIKYKSTNALVTRVGLVYTTEWKFFGIAIGCMFVQVLIILFLIWGWQKLGREVSLDPFEIAKAMGAPLLNHGSSNSSADQILDLLGSRKVRYGELIDVETEASGEQEMPKRGYTVLESQDPEIMMGHQNTSMSFNTRKTLGISVLERVQDVRAGEHY